jgi:hypothetical protein
MEGVGRNCVQLSSNVSPFNVVVAQQDHEPTISRKVGSLLYYTGRRGSWRVY